MSSAEAGPAAAVTKSGGCERTVLLGNDKHVVKLSWRYVYERGVLVTATLVDPKHKKRPSQTQSSYAKENTEEAVSKKAAELTEKVLKNKRELWQKARQRSGGGSSAGGVRRTADSAVADPVITALRGGGRTRSRVQTSQPAERETAPVDWRQQSTETFLASMDSIGHENALRHLEKVGSTFAKDTIVCLRELEAKASTSASLERAIEQAEKQRRTIEGRHTLQTILTAAAFPVDDVNGAPSISAKRRAAAMGVQERAFNFAAERAKKLLSDLHPTEAIKRGVFWFWPRAKSSSEQMEG
ncbi:unnamed protein product [Ectocarpus sp. 4 AP-2014]